MYPQDYQALIPFSYRDYMIAFQAKRVCTTKKDAMLEISGIHENGYNWQIPFIRCDSRKCQYLGQDAQDFCEYSIIAVTGSNRQDEGGRLRSIQFKQWMYDTYPVLYKRKAANETLGMPFDFDFVQLWSDPHEMDRYVQRPDYGTLGVPKLAMGIVFDGNTPNIYKYWLRQNSTGLNTPEQTVLGRKFIAQSTPPTDRLFDNFAKSDTSACPRDSEAANLGKYKNSCTGLYLYNGVIATQRLVGDFILSQTGAAAAGYSVSDGGVQFIQFPQHPYVASGFFASIQGKSCARKLYRKRRDHSHILARLFHRYRSNAHHTWFAISVCSLNWLYCTRKGTSAKRVYEDDERPGK